MAQSKTKKPPGPKAIAVNRRARHDYFIDESFEAGIVLVGSEVKSLREGRANLTDGYARISRGEVFLVNAHISHYAAANMFNHEPTRTRKLLMHKKEIGRLTGKVKERGLTLIPLKLYFKEGMAKVELGLARGKKNYDKRDSIKEKAVRREMERTMKSHRRG